MRALIILSTLVTLQVASAQERTADLSSPYKSIETFLLNLQPETYNDSLAAQPFNPTSRSLAIATKSAIKLKRILDGKGLYIYMDEVPKQPNYYDSAARKHKFILTENYSQVFLLKAEDGKWYFSDSSIDAIGKLYSETFRFGSGKLLDILPKLGTRKILGLYLYQYIAILILAFFSTLIYRLFTFVASKIFKKAMLSAGYQKEAYQKYVWMIARPSSVFFIVLLLLIFAPALQLPPEYSNYVNTGLRVMLPLFGTVILYRLVNIAALYLAKMARKTESTLDDQLVPLLRKTLKTFVVIIGTLFILDNLDVPILPLLTGLSIGGLAFALAAQDTIKNFFGSIMIFVDKPFQVGDWISSGDLDGTVEEVGFRSSRVRTFRNSLIYVPNGKLADSTIDNHGLRRFRRFYTQIAVIYDTPPELIEAFVDGLRKIIQENDHTNKENFHVYLNEMAASSLNIMFYIFFEVPSWSDELKARHEVLLSIIRLAKELGVNFAFPTQTLHVENLPGQPSLSPKYLSGDEAKVRLENFFQRTSK